MFMQYFGGAVFLSVAKTIFTNELLSTLRKYAPDIDAHSIVHSGATSVFHGLSEHDRLLVLNAYNKALITTFVSQPGPRTGIRIKRNVMTWANEQPSSGFPPYLPSLHFCLVLAWAGKSCQGPRTRPKVRRNLFGVKVFVGCIGILKPRISNTRLI